MSSPVRIVIPIDSMNSESFGYAAAYAAKIASQQTAPVQEVVLLTHTKAQLRHTSLAGFIGDAAAKALDQGRHVGLGSGVSLRHATMQTLSSLLPKGILIVFYAEDRILEFVDGLKGLAGVVAVPEFSDSANNWIARWNPVVHGQERRAPTVLLDDAVVEAALKTVTGIANLAHSVMHPRDKEFAKEVLRILKAKGHKLAPDQIKSWAIRNGWLPRAAQELADVATKIAGLKNKPSLSGVYNAKERYERWKAEAVTE